MSNIFDQFDGEEDDVLREAPPPGLAERFRVNFEAGYRLNTVAGAVRDASSDARASDRRRFDEQLSAFPEWSGFMEGAAALGGQVAGTAASVENFVPVGLGARLVATGKTGLTGLWARIFAGAVDGAAVNAVTDTAIQGIEQGAGFRDGFDPVQLLAGTALGGVIGGAGGAVARGIEVTRDRRAARATADAEAANPFDQFDEPAASAERPPAAAPGEQPPDAPPAAPDAAPAAPDAPPATPDASPSASDLPPARPDAAPAAGIDEIAAGYNYDLNAMPDDVARQVLETGSVETRARSLIAQDIERASREIEQLKSLKKTTTKAPDGSFVLDDVLPDGTFAGRVDPATEAKRGYSVRERNARVAELSASIEDLRAQFTGARPIAEDRLTFLADLDSVRRPLGETLSEQAAMARLGEEPAPSTGRRQALSEGRTGKASDTPQARTAGQEFLGVEPTRASLLVRKGNRKRAEGGTGPGADPSAGPVARVRETAEELARQLGVGATRQGRMSNAKALGLFYTRSGAVRVRSLDDFDTLTHEYGHHVDAKIPLVKKWIRKNSAALRLLDYDQKLKRDYEGFAEFFRLWITNRAYVMENFAGLGPEFEKLLSAEPKIKAAIDAATEAYDAFIRAPSTVAVSSTIVSARQKGRLDEARKALREQGVGGTISDVLGRLYSFFLDELNPLSRAVSYLTDLHKANTGKDLIINVGSDAYKLARMSRGAFSAGHMDIMYGVAPYRGLNPETPSLRDAIVEATGKPNALSGWDDAKVLEFGSYLWSRRALGEWQRFLEGKIPRAPDKLTLGDHQTNVAELAAANPTFASAAEKIYQWNLALWKKKLDAGLITTRVYEEGLQIADYVPGLRDFTSATDEKMPAGKPRRTKDLKFGVARRFQGSKRDVINPLESLAADAYETAMTIARNDVVKALDRLAKTAGLGGSRIAEEIPVTQLTATMVDPIEAVESAARNAGLSGPDIVTLRDAIEGAIGDEKAAIFRPAMISEKGEPIVFFRDGGDLRALRLADGAFGRDMYRALTSMSQQERNFWVELVAMPARVLRLGITTSFDFIGANFIRDQTMAWIYYGRPLRRVGASLRGATDDIMGSQVAKRYARVGGITGGQETASLSRVRAQRDISRLARKGWVAQRLTSFRGVLETVEIAETASRLGLFRTFHEEAKARGLSDMEAALEASWRARDYMDFDRRGSGMAALARVIPFLNAALQGTDKTARHMIAPLARRALGHAKRAGDDAAMGEAVKAWARVAAAATATISLYALMRNHEDHDEISDYTKSTHWTIKAGEKWLAIPKPFEFGVVFNLAEAAFDAMVEKDPTALGRWLDNLHFSLAPPSLLEGNPGIKSYFELRTNTNLFTGADIVPEHLRGMEPFLQYTARNSALSRQLGKAFDMSPAVIDHLIMNHLASWGRSALALYDMAQPDAPATGWDDAPIMRRFIKDASKGAQSTTQFWELMGSRTGVLEGKAQSYRQLGAAERADYYARQNEQAKVYIALSTHKADVKRLHPLVRARNAVQAIGTMRREMAAGKLLDADGNPLQVSAAGRTAADDVLGTLAMAIARNALVTVGEPGWAQRRPIDEQGFYRELETIDPALLTTLSSLFADKKVWRAEAVGRSWPELRQRLLQDGTQADLIDLVIDVESEGLELDGVKRPKPPRPEVPPAG